MPRALRGGFPTCWRVWGSGPRAAVMIHCSLAHHGEWSEIAGRLGDDLRMTAFDLPGHGKSGDWDGRGDYQAVAVGMAADLIEGRADLIGHSFGGTVALRLAIEQPEKVRSLTLIEPVFFSILRDSGLEVAQRERADWDRLLAEIAGGRVDEAARHFLGRWGVQKDWQDMPEAQRAYAAARMDLLLAGGAQIYGDAAGLERRLGELDLPVLILHGTRSPAVMAPLCEALQARIPGARRHLIEGAAHMSPVTHPGAVAGRIAVFLGLPASRE